MSIHAFNQRETLLGQGTVGLEFEQQYPRLDTLLVSVGGGGLIGGIASWYGSKIKLIGVEPEAAPTLSNALAAGHPVDSPLEESPPILSPKTCRRTHVPLAQTYVEKVILVNDHEIAQAQEALWSVLRIVTEPGGAAAFAAYSPRLPTQAGRTCRHPTLRSQHHRRDLRCQSDKRPRSDRQCLIQVFKCVIPSEAEEPAFRSPISIPHTKELHVVYDKLKSLNIALPKLDPSVAAFVPFVRTGNLVFISGHIAKKDGKPWTGKLGAELTTRRKARGASNCYRSARDAASRAGDLNKIRRIVKLLVLVNSAPTFTEQHLVANGASELFIEVFGRENGVHSRSAFGVAQIPLGLA